MKSEENFKGVNAIHPVYHRVECENLEHNVDIVKEL